MDFYMQNSYLDLLLVAFGFLIVLLTRYSFSDLDDDEKLEADGDDSFPPPRQRRFSCHPMMGNPPPNPASNNRRHSFSYSPNSSTVGYPKRRGRRTFGIKHL